MTSEILNELDEILKRMGALRQRIAGGVVYPSTPTPPPPPAPPAPQAALPRAQAQGQRPASVPPVLPHFDSRAGQVQEGEEFIYEVGAYRWNNVADRTTGAALGDEFVLYDKPRSGRDGIMCSMIYNWHPARKPTTWSKEITRVQFLEALGQPLDQLGFGGTGNDFKKDWQPWPVTAPRCFAWVKFGSPKGDGKYHFANLIGLMVGDKKIGAFANATPATPAPPPNPVQAAQANQTLFGGPEGDGPKEYLPF